MQEYAGWTRMSSSNKYIRDDTCHSQHHPILEIAAAVKSENKTLWLNGGSVMGRVKADECGVW